MEGTRRHLSFTLFLVLFSIPSTSGGCEKEAIDPQDPWAPCGRDRYCSVQRIGDICRECADIKTHCDNMSLVWEKFQNCTAYCERVHAEEKYKHLETQCERDKNTLKGNLTRVTEAHNQTVTQATQAYEHLREKYDKQNTDIDDLQRDLIYLNESLRNTALEQGTSSARFEELLRNKTEIINTLNETLLQQQSCEGENESANSWVVYTLSVLLAVSLVVNLCTCYKAVKRRRKGTRKIDRSSVEAQPLTEIVHEPKEEEPISDQDQHEPPTTQDREEPSAPIEVEVDSGAGSSTPGSSTPQTTPESTPPPTHNPPNLRVINQPSSDDKGRLPTYAIGASSPPVVILHATPDTPS
ncbi:hypothetical protein BaRGS_00006722 [Batillaria attramentaria]|uniref:Uncharacterized protein n=1 Tax=Batillaria attramentaria TaxID=370345 RepID=A0ABD0LR25_9CAEN